ITRAETIPATAAVTGDGVICMLPLPFVVLAPIMTAAPPWREPDHRRMADRTGWGLRDARTGLARTRPGNRSSGGRRRRRPGTPRSAGRGSVGGAAGGRARGAGAAVALVGEVALLVAVLLEVGLVPAAAGKAERRRGHLAADLARRVAGGADLRIGIGQLLQAVEGMTAGSALEGVDGHGTHAMGKTRSAMGMPIHVFKGRLPRAAVRP